MKKLLRSLLLSTVLFGSLTLTSCSSFFGQDMAGYTIQDVATEQLANGDIQVTITYVNEEQEPYVFIVPKGEDGVVGKDGTGIKEIKVEKDENLNQIITIIYTDDTKEPVSYVVPSVVSIVDVTSEKDEETGNEIITIHYSDGTKSNPITLPAGKDGVGIESIEHFINMDFSVSLTIKLSSGTDYNIVIPAPIKGEQGEEGRGISSIVSSPNGDDYTLTINYTDGTSDTLPFARPNKWFSEACEPSSEYGIDGDLWFNLNDSSIYHKENGVWINIINLSENTTIKYTVRFDANGGNLPFGTQISYQVVSGKYFSSTGYSIPIPTKDGSIFKGWYTSKSINPTIGCFTDLTPVCSDLTLYAIWENA